MSINPERLKNRLAKTVKALDEVTKELTVVMEENTSTEIKKLTKVKEDAEATVDAQKILIEGALSLTATHQAKLSDPKTPANTHPTIKKDIEGIEKSVAECNKKISEASSTMNLTEMNLKYLTWNFEQFKRDLQEKQIDLTVAKAKQEAAVAKKEAAYPALLKRHIGYCRRHRMAAPAASAAKVKKAA